eukprot:5319226-Karenia_brevis.AAC.1
MAQHCVGELFRGAPWEGQSRWILWAPVTLSSCGNTQGQRDLECCRSPEGFGQEGKPCNEEGKISLLQDHHVHCTRGSAGGCSEAFGPQQA